MKNNESRIIKYLRWVPALIVMMLALSAGITYAVYRNSSEPKSVNSYKNVSTAEAFAAALKDVQNNLQQKAGETKIKEALIVIDPGHGGEDTGTIHGNVFEKNINLDISLRLGELLEKEAVKIVYTREKDETVELRSRAYFANDLDATLFISVHNNMMPGSEAYRGTETLYAASANKRYPKMSDKKLAAIVQKELVDELKTIDNGTIYRPNLAVLHRTNMPAIIAEVGYISNRSDRSKLVTPEFRQRAAEALKKAVIKALGEMGAYKDNNGKWMLGSQK